MLCQQVDEAGIDMLLVGDSVGMVVHGHDTTLPVTLEDMLLHCRAVARGARCAHVCCRTELLCALSLSTPCLQASLPGWRPALWQL